MSINFFKHTIVNMIKISLRESKAIPCVYKFWNSFISMNLKILNT